MVEVLHGQGWSSGDVGAQKRDAWGRRKKGESVHEIADALGKHADSIYWLMVSHGGFAPSRRHRGRWVLSLPEREEILRGLAQR